jgi:Zn-dependent metalloprotease
LGIDTAVRNKRFGLHTATPPNSNLGTQQSVTATSERGQKSISVYDCRKRFKLPGFRVRSDDQRVKDRVVNNAFDGLQIADKFFRDVFAYKIPDDTLSALTGSVHFRENYNKAIWDGQRMIFSDGDEETFDYFANSLDVIVHEITHGVT